MISVKYLYAGHHKCASSYVKSILNSIASILNMEIGEAMDSKELISQEKRLDKVDFFYLLNANRNVAKTVIENLDNVKGFHVIRDPRDLIVSAYFSHLYSHPTSGWNVLLPHRAKLESLSKKDGIIAELEFCSEWMEDLYSWDYLENGNILDVKFEQIVEAPYLQWLKILKHLDILNEDLQVNDSIKDISMELFRRIQSKILVNSTLNKNEGISPYTALGIVYDHRFEALTKGRKTGSEDIKHHYRKGIPGDWRNHFDNEIIDCFKEKYNNLLLKLDYESESNWEDGYSLKVKY